LDHLQQGLRIGHHEHDLMTSHYPQALAAEFHSAYTTGEPVLVPPSKREGEFDLSTAYATESEFRRLRMAEGHKPVGLKVGFANKAMWRMLKLDTLVWAHMYEDTVHTADSDEAGFAPSRYGTLRLEPEIVVRLNQPLTAAGLDAVKVLEAVEWVAVGFEIIDCPFPNWEFKPADFVASFGLHRALIVGKPLNVEPSMIPQLADDLARFKLKLFRDGEPVEEGSGRNSLRSPALCVAELAAALAARGNAGSLSAGDLVSTGTLTNPQTIARGEVWRADVEGLLPSDRSSLTLRLA
jgi:2-oxo-3-hexenedioate decarboxylase